VKKILLIEDDERKLLTIRAFLNERGVPDSQVIVAKTMTDFAASLNADIGLFIIDLKLPCLDDVVASQNGKAILETIIKSGKSDALLVAISSYPNDFPELRQFYESRGCILSDFNNTESWKSTLDHLLIQLKKSITFDFVIFCALQEERNPYVVLLDGKQVTRNGVDCFDVSLSNAQGTVVLLPKMGLVNAAVTAAQCIDRFGPHVVGMSGICAGFKDRAAMGQLLISSMAYEYQSGKWLSDRFMNEPYQVPTDHLTLASLKSLTNTEGLIVKLEAGFSGTRPKEAHKPDVGIFTSGSAVIADKTYMKEIEMIHRKVNGLDMEVFGIQRAAELSPLKPPCICAKTVVDLGDNKKDDAIHAYGAYISAKFLILALNDYFDRHAPGQE
jgi:nucleoside phosphorylase/CheY-like chemotaxis protein